MQETPPLSRRRKRLLRRVKRRSLTSLFMLVSIFVIPLIFRRYEDFNSLRRTVFQDLPFLQNTPFHTHALLSNLSLFYTFLVFLNLYALFTWLFTMESTKDRRLKKRLKRLDTVRFLTFLVFLFVMLNTFVVSLASVSGPSMETTFLNGDDVLMWHFNETFSHGDVVVVQVEQNAQTSYFIKRLIGLPGDHVVLDAQAVFVNGVVLDEPYLDPGVITSCPAFNGVCDVILGEGEYFVLGDNRAASNDSRHIGLIEEDALFGQVVFRLRPLSRFGRVQS